MKVLSLRQVAFSTRPHFWTPIRSILKDVNLEVESAEIFGFLGPNGAGKTTTLKTILGLITPTHGEIEVLGGSTTDPDIRAKIGFMPERSYYPEHLTASELVGFHANLAGADASSKHVDDILERVGLSEARHRELRAFSKGMLQRVGLAQALVASPQLLLLDEPLSGLDPIGRKQVRDILVDLRQQGCTVLFSTHILADVELVAQRICILREGTVKVTGSIQELLAKTENGIDIVARNLSPSLLEKLPPPQGHEAEAYRFHFQNIEQANAKLDILRAEGALIQQVVPHRMSLEELFMKEARGET